MKNFIKQIIIYFLMTFVGWFILVFIAANSFKSWQPYLREYTNIPVGSGNAGGSSVIRFTEINNYSNVDILFIGSSHFYRGIDPRVFKSDGYEIFNMGSTSQSTLNSYFLLNEFIDRLSPKLVVVEAYGRILGSEGLKSFYDLALNVPQLSSTVEMALATKEFKAIDYYFARKLSIQNRSIELKLHSNDSYIAGGYVKREQLSAKGKWAFDTLNVTINQIQLDYLNRIIMMMKDRKIKIVLLEIPVATVLQQATLNIAELRKLVAQLAAHNNIPFINLNEFIQLDDHKYFFDEDHLNYLGAEKVSKKIVEVLKKHNLLK